MSISVVARIRPLADDIGLGSYINSREAESSSRAPTTLPSIAPTTSTSIFSMPSKKSVNVNGSSFRYLEITVSGSCQLSAYSSLGQPLLNHLSENLNPTIIAYGQTGSGKTFTMFGPPGALTLDSLLSSAPACPPSWGLFPRTVFTLLQSSRYSSISISALSM